MYRALGVTPTQSKDMDFAAVTTICHDYTLNALTNMTAHARNPFRFIYTSGVAAERDQAKTPPFLAEYLLMRVCVKTVLFSLHSSPASASKAFCGRHQELFPPPLLPFSECQKKPTKIKGRS